MGSNNLQAMEKITAGNKAYLDGNYSLALEAYTKANELAGASSGLNFNIGNTNYRLKDFSAALAFYRQAQDLNPRDAELKTNIELTKRESKQQTSVDQAMWFDYVPLREFASKTEFLGVFSVFLSCSLLLLILKRFSGLLSAQKDFAALFNSIPNTLTAGLGVLSAFFAMAAFAKHSETEPGRRAVVKAQESSARSDASEQSVELFKITQLAEVRVLSRSSDKESKEGWVRIKTSAKNAGWVKAEDLLTY